MNKNSSDKISISKWSSPIYPVTRDDASGNDTFDDKEEYHDYIFPEYKDEEEYEEYNLEEDSDIKEMNSPDDNIIDNKIKDVDLQLSKNYMDNYNMKKSQAFNKNIGNVKGIPVTKNDLGFSKADSKLLSTDYSTQDALTFNEDYYLNKLEVILNESDSSYEDVEDMYNELNDKNRNIINSKYNIDPNSDYNLFVDKLKDNIDLQKSIEELHSGQGSSFKPEYNKNDYQSANLDTYLNNKEKSEKEIDQKYMEIYDGLSSQQRTAIFDSYKKELNQNPNLKFINYLKKFIDGKDEKTSPVNIEDYSNIPDLNLSKTKDYDENINPGIFAFKKFNSLSSSEKDIIKQKYKEAKKEEPDLTLNNFLIKYFNTTDKDKKLAFSDKELEQIEKSKKERNEKYKKLTTASNFYPNLEELVNSGNLNVVTYLSYIYHDRSGNNLSNNVIKIILDPKTSKYTNIEKLENPDKFKNQMTASNNTNIFLEEFVNYRKKELLKNKNVILEKYGNDLYYVLENALEEFSLRIEYLAKKYKRLNDDLQDLERATLDTHKGENPIDLNYLNNTYFESIPSDKKEKDLYDIFNTAFKNNFKLIPKEKIKKYIDKSLNDLLDSKGIESDSDKDADKESIKKSDKYADKEYIEKISRYLNILDNGMDIQWLLSKFLEADKDKFKIKPIYIDSDKKNNFIKLLVDLFNKNKKGFEKGFNLNEIKQFQLRDILLASKGDFSKFIANDISNLINYSKISNEDLSDKNKSEEKRKTLTNIATKSVNLFNKDIIKDPNKEVPTEIVEAIGKIIFEFRDKNNKIIKNNVLNNEGKKETYIVSTNTILKLFQQTNIYKNSFKNNFINLFKDDKYGAIDYLINIIDKLDKNKDINKESLKKQLKAINIETNIEEDFSKKFKLLSEEIKKILTEYIYTNYENIDSIINIFFMRFKEIYKEHGYLFNKLTGAPNILLSNYYLIINILLRDECRKELNEEYYTLPDEILSKTNIDWVFDTQFKNRSIVRNVNALTGANRAHQNTIELTMAKGIGSTQTSLGTNKREIMDSPGSKIPFTSTQSLVEADLGDNFNWDDLNPEDFNKLINSAEYKQDEINKKHELDDAIRKGFDINKINIENSDDNNENDENKGFSIENIESSEKEVKNLKNIPSKFQNQFHKVVSKNIDREIINKIKKGNITGVPLDVFNTFKPYINLYNELVTTYGRKIDKGNDNKNITTKTSLKYIDDIKNFDKIYTAVLRNKEKSDIISTSKLDYIDPLVKKILEKKYNIKPSNEENEDNSNLLSYDRLVMDINNLSSRQENLDKYYTNTINGLKEILKNAGNIDIDKNILEEFVSQFKEKIQKIIDSNITDIKTYKQEIENLYKFYLNFKNKLSILVDPKGENPNPLPIVEGSRDEDIKDSNLDKDLNKKSDKDKTTESNPFGGKNLSLNVNATDTQRAEAKTKEFVVINKNDDILTKLSKIILKINNRKPYIENDKSDNSILDYNHVLISILDTLEDSNFDIKKDLNIDIRNTKIEANNLDLIKTNILKLLRTNKYLGDKKINILIDSLNKENITENINKIITYLTNSLPETKIYVKEKLEEYLDFKKEIDKSDIKEKLDDKNLSKDEKEKLEKEFAKQFNITLNVNNKSKYEDKLPDFGKQEELSANEYLLNGIRHYYEKIINIEDNVFYKNINKNFNIIQNLVTRIIDRFNSDISNVERKGAKVKNSKGEEISLDNIKKSLEQEQNKYINKLDNLNLDNVNKDLIEKINKEGILKKYITYKNNPLIYDYIVKEDREIANDNYNYFNNSFKIINEFLEKYKNTNIFISVAKKAISVDLSSIGDFDDFNLGEIGLDNVEELNEAESYEGQIENIESGSGKEATNELDIAKSNLRKVISTLKRFEPHIEEVIKEYEEKIKGGVKDQQESIDIYRDAIKKIYNYKLKDGTEFKYFINKFFSTKLLLQKLLSQWGVFNLELKNGLLDIINFNEYDKNNIIEKSIYSKLENYETAKEVLSDKDTKKIIDKFLITYEGIKKKEEAIRRGFTQGEYESMEKDEDTSLNLVKNVPIMNLNVSVDGVRLEQYITNCWELLYDMLDKYIKSTNNNRVSLYSGRNSMFTADLTNALQNLNFQLTDISCNMNIYFMYLATYKRYIELFMSRIGNDELNDETYNKWLNYIKKNKYHLYNKEIDTLEKFKTKFIDNDKIKKKINNVNKTPFYSNGSYNPLNSDEFKNLYLKFWEKFKSLGNIATTLNPFTGQNKESKKLYDKDEVNKIFNFDDINLEENKNSYKKSFIINRINNIKNKTLETNKNLLLEIKMLYKDL